MRNEIIPVVLALVTVAWVVLGVIRDMAVVRHAEVQHALQFYTHQQSQKRLSELHQESIQRLTRRDDLPQGQTDAPEFPEWLHAYVTVEEDDNGWFGYSIKSSVGGYLASVPVVWFHGTFAIIHLVLIFLMFVFRRL